MRSRGRGQGQCQSIHGRCQPNRRAEIRSSWSGTTATRAGDRLVIQNDIGTTDAHVIVIHVEALTVTITYSDVHPERVRFLQAMLEVMNVAWNDGQTAQVTTLAEGMPFQLVTGSFRAGDAAGVQGVS